jgi:hypothetical protein
VEEGVTATSMEIVDALVPERERNPRSPVEVAVFVIPEEREDGGDASLEITMESAYLSDLLIKTINRTGEGSVLALHRSRLDQVLKSHGLSPRDCFEVEKAMEAGASAGVAAVAMGCMQWIPDQEMHSLSLAVFDVQTGELTRDLEPCFFQSFSAVEHLQDHWDESLLRADKAGIYVTQVDGSEQIIKPLGKKGASSGNQVVEYVEVLPDTVCISPDCMKIAWMEMIRTRDPKWIERWHVYLVVSDRSGENKKQSFNAFLYRGMGRVHQQILDEVLRLRWEDAATLVFEIELKIRHGDQEYQPGCHSLKVREDNTTYACETASW